MKTMLRVWMDGGIRPAKSSPRTKLIAEMIERKIILSEQINGLHPLTFSGLKAFLTIGYTVYSFTPHCKGLQKLSHYNFTLLKMLDLKTIVLPSRGPWIDFQTWCINNDVCASMATSNNIAEYDYANIPESYCDPYQQIKFFRIHSADIPLVKLRWS